MRVLMGVMTAVFTLAVVVQWNDPDPLIWMALYGLAALISLGALFDHYFPRVTLGLGVLYGAGVAYTFPAVMASRLAAYTSFKMRSPDDEVARECVGLILCAVWMFVVWRRGASARVPAAEGS